MLRGTFGNDWTHLVCSNCITFRLNIKVLAQRIPRLSYTSPTSWELTDGNILYWVLQHCSWIAACAVYMQLPKLGTQLNPLLRAAALSPPAADQPPMNISRCDAFFPKEPRGHFRPVITSHYATLIHALRPPGLAMTQLHRHARIGTCGGMM